QRLAARRAERVPRIVARDADLPFGLLVIRLQIAVGDGPVFERAAGHLPVRGAHAEIPLHVTPRHGAVAQCAAAHASRIVAVAWTAGPHHVRAALQIHGYPRIALVIRPEGVAEYRGALVTQIVFAAIERRIRLAAFQQDHAQPGFRQLLGDDTARRPRAHHHRVDAVHARPRNGGDATPSIFQLARSRLPPCRGSP